MNPILFQGRRFRVEQVFQPTAEGNLREREVVRHPGAVTVLPLLADGRVCLIRNYRVSVDKTLIELPAGTLEPGEDPLVTAERELIEETGYRCSKIELLHSFYLSPGILDERMHLYLATGLTLGETAREEGELIENLLLPLEESLALIDRGEIQDAKTMAGLLYYERVRCRANV
jgi:ADP-ribose pyrophosphatase